MPLRTYTCCPSSNYQAERAEWVEEELPVWAPWVGLLTLVNIFRSHEAQHDKEVTAQHHEKDSGMMTLVVLPNHVEVSRMTLQYGCNLQGTCPVHSGHISHLHVHVPSCLLQKVVAL